MNINHPPIVRLEVEHMKSAILHAFSERMVNLSAELQVAVDRACDPIEIQRTLDKAAREAIHGEVDRATRQWWIASEEGKKLIKEAVARRMEEEAKYYRSQYE